MKTNESGITLIKSFEGLRLKAYKPVPSEKYYTVGYGHYGPDVKPGMIITEEQAEALLKKDIELFEIGVEKVIDENITLTSNQFSALVSFSFNVGLENFKKSTLLKMINKGNKDELEAIHSQFKRWVWAGSQILPGLQRRREAEFKLYSTPESSESMTEGNIDDFYKCDLK